MGKMHAGDNPNKIIIIGTSGCGKSTLGRCLADITGYRLIDLDELRWLPNWQKRPTKEYQALLRAECDRDHWIVSGGNRSKTREITWSQADMIIWLDLPLRSCLWRTWKRSFNRCLKKESCCNGNYESWSRLFSRHSMLKWVWNSYPKRKKTFDQLFSSHQGDCRLLRLKSQKQVQTFIRSYSQL